MKQIIFALGFLLLIVVGCSEPDLGETNKEHLNYFNERTPWVYVNDKDSITLSGLGNHVFFLKVYDITLKPAKYDEKRSLHRNRCYTNVKYRKGGRPEYLFEMYNSTIGSVGDSVYGEINKEMYINYTLENDVLTLYNAMADYKELKLQWIKDVYPWREQNLEKEFPDNTSNYFVNITTSDSTVLIQNKYKDTQWSYEKYKKKNNRWDLEVIRENNYCVRHKQLLPKTYDVDFKYFYLRKSQNGYNDEEIKYTYENELLTLYNYAEQAKQELHITTQTTETMNPKVLEGIWSATFAKDSVVLVFEDNLMKEYLYNRDNPSQILDYKHHGKYELQSYVNSYKDIILESRKILKLGSKSQSCILNRNSLILTNNAITTTYSRVE